MAIHAGSWLGLPDLGLTEYLGSLLGVQQNPGTGGTGLSNLITRTPNPGPIAPPPPQYPQPQYTSAYQSRPGNTFGQVLGAATQTGGGGGGGGGIQQLQGQQGGQNNGQNTADLAYRAALANANSYRERGMQTFNDILKSVGAFRERAGALRDAGNQDVTNTAANELGSNATTAQQLAASANAQGRNLGLSSKVNLGQRILGNLQGTQGNVLATKGSNLRQNENLYQSRQDQANAQEDQANQYKQGIESGVNQLQAGGLSDYTGALSNIAQRAQALAAINPLNSGGLTGYTPDFSGVQNTLNGIFSGIGSPAGGTSPVDASNLVNDPTFQAYLRKARGLYQG